MNFREKYVVSAFVLVMFCGVHSVTAAAAAAESEAHTRNTDAELSAALHAAVKSFDCDRVEQLLTQGANPSVPDERGRTAFGYAVTSAASADPALHAKKQRIVRALHGAGGDDPKLHIYEVNFLDTIDIIECDLAERYRAFYELRDHDGDPLRSHMLAPLATIVRDYVGDFDVAAVPHHPLKLRNQLTKEQNNAPLLNVLYVHLVLKALYQGADVDYRDEKTGMTSLHGIASNQLDGLYRAKLLFRHRANVDARDKYERTPLHRAAEHDHHEFVQLLLRNKANINAQDKTGWTPLHHAVRWGSEKAARLLLRDKANIEAQAKEKCTPLLTAARNNQDTMVQLLLNNKASLQAQSELGRTALHVASIYAGQWVMKALLPSRANVDTHDGEGLTPLHYAAQREEPEIARLLLSYRADIEAIDHKDRSPLDMAKESKREKVIDLLFDNGAVGERPCRCVIA